MIGILPTALGLFLIAAIFKLSFLYTVLYVLVAVAVVSRVWARLALRQIRVDRRFSPRALHGEHLTLELTVTNAGPIPIPWLRIHDRLPVAIATAANVDHVLSLGPRRQITLRVETVGRQRGWYALGPVTVETGDVFGFARVEADFLTTGRLTVLPRIVPIRRVGLPSRLPFGDIRTRAPLFSDPARTMGTRAYVAGDSMRLIHWRATAAAGEVLVRKLEPAMTLETIVALDLSAAAYEPASLAYASELAVVSAASIVSHLAALRQEVGLITNGRDPMSGDDGVLIVGGRKGAQHRIRLLELLARITVAPSRPIEEELRRATATLSFGQTIVIVTPRVTKMTDSCVESLRRAGFAVALLIVARRSEFDDGLVPVLRPGVQRHTIWRESDLEYASDEVVRRRPSLRAG